LSTFSVAVPFSITAEPIEPLAVWKLTVPVESAAPETSDTLAVNTVCGVLPWVSCADESWIRAAACAQASVHVPVHIKVEITTAANAKPALRRPVRVQLPSLNHCKFILRVLCSLKKRLAKS
jgi:hypothetical protein